MRRALSLFAAAVVMLVSAKASASFHLMKVVEVFAGSTAHPTASYVQLQMYAPGQSFISGHFLHVYAANGVEIPADLVTFDKSVANANDQSFILIGTADVSTAFGVTPDFTLKADLLQAGGAVCYDALDCFSWGNFTGTTSDTSVSPFAALTADKAARRIITGGASATLLEAADDGNNNAMDFAPVDPAPKNNSFGATVIPDAGPGVDASVPDGSTSGGSSGIGTMPSPNNPVITPDSGTSTPSSSSGGDSGGCNVVASPTSSSEGWSTVLGLCVAASILVLSRRSRRRKSR